MITTKYIPQSLEYSNCPVNPIEINEIIKEAIELNISFDYIDWNDRAGIEIMFEKKRKKIIAKELIMTLKKIKTTLQGLIKNTTIKRENHATNRA